jgi:ribosomal protein S12 methylthiotransferase
MKFEAVGVFEYSHEEGTVAGTMESNPKLAVPQEEKLRRKDEVMRTQQEICFARAKALAGRFDEKRPLDARGKPRGAQVDVIVDHALRVSGMKTSGVGSGGKLYEARTTFQAPQIDAVTFVQSREKLAPGEVVRCTVVGSDGYDLIARPSSELEKKLTLNILK